MDSTKIQGTPFLDILFSGRNKDYGAYELRNRYDRRVRNSIIGTASVILVVIGGYVLDNTLKAADNVRPLVVTKDPTVLKPIDIPEEKKFTPPPPPVTSAPPPMAASIRNTTPVIVDKDVPPDEMPPKQTDMDNKVIGFKTADGVEDGAQVDLGASGIGGSGVVKVEAPAEEDKGPRIFVEIMPEFPGGEPALAKYLKNHMRYPTQAQDNDVQGTVFVQFVVNRDGSITDVKTVGAAKGAGLEEEAKRVVNAMPKWKPGRQNGQNVPVLFNLPIRFVLGQQ